MGLYDTVSCKLKLPLPVETDKLSEFGSEPIEKLMSFQTKCLGRGMSHYEIREDGTLWIEKYEIKYVDDPDFEKKYSELFDTTYISQKAVRYNETWVPYHVHNQVVNIYEFYSPMNENYEYVHKFDYWVEYNVTFSNSIVSDVKLVKFEKRNRDDKDARLAELFESIKPSRRVQAIRAAFKFWRKITRWVPSSHSVESYIIDKL